MILNPDKMKKFRPILFLAIFSLINFSSCKVNYSFKGAVIPVSINTFSVQYFPNRAPLVQAQLSQTFTDALKDKIEGQTRLKMVTGFGDVDFSGEIQNYETRPTAISGNETAALNRLTITVRVKFTDSINPDNSWESSFSRYEDYESSKNLTDVEEDLIELILENILEDIYNKAFVNW